MWYIGIMKHITQVEALKGYRLRLQFSDGAKGVVDVSDLVGKGVFSAWTDFDEFRKVKIGSSGELVWDDRIDLCADALYMKITGKKPEEIFPGLKMESVCA